MYSYLRGVYRGQPVEGSGILVVEAGGIGYEVLVPPIVEQEVLATCAEDEPILLHVSAQSGRDQPWPVLFGFLRPEERAFWELLKSVPRIGGKGAARAMAVPLSSIARAIHEGNKAFLDTLPGITVDGAEKMIASLRRKMVPFLETRAPATMRQSAGPAEELRTDAVQLLVVMGVKRPDAQRAVDELLATRDDLVGIQDIITEYFRAHQNLRT